MPLMADYIDLKNRSFEFPQNLMGWKTFGNVTLQDDGPFEKNPHYVRLSDPGHPHKHTGLDNEGFFGIGVKAGEEYRFSVWARLPQGGTAEKIEAAEELNLATVLICPPVYHGICYDSLDAVYEQAQAILK